MVLQWYYIDVLRVVPSFACLFALFCCFDIWMKKCSILLTSCTATLHWFCSCITFLLQWSHSGVTLGLQWYRIGVVRVSSFACLLHFSCFLGGNFINLLTLGSDQDCADYRGSRGYQGKHV
jgi:apolipoprotein N-acyltransferase